MRVDFNVPRDKTGEITDDTRIRAALPSIKWVIEQGGALILMSHLGRPKGKSEEFTLKPCATRLKELLGRPVGFVEECIGPDVERRVKELKPGEILLLENLRFYAAEEKPEKDPSFATRLAQLGDVYINDAFGSSHRAHSSITEVPKLFKEKGAGFLLEKEIKFLSEMLKNPERPFVAIVGGAKVSGKIGVLEALQQKTDQVLIGGAMAFPFLKACGMNVGSSFVEEGFDLPKGNFVLPIDFVCEKEGEVKVFAVEEGIEAGWKGMDIGPKTTLLFKKWIEGAQTIFWNGPLGVFEDPRFANGTNEIARAIAESGAISVIGGGDSVAAIEKIGLENKITHLSTGGGASLELIELGSLPGIDALVL